MENNNNGLKTIMVKIDDKDHDKHLEKIQSGDIYISAEEYDKSKEKKTYVVLYIGTDEDGNDVKSFEVVEGRKETFEFIKTIVDFLDIHESKILTDNVTYKEAASVYDFMQYVSSMIEGDSFDIEDYNHGYNKRTESEDV